MRQIIVGAKHSDHQVSKLTQIVSENALSLPVEKIVNYATQIAEGLQAAHAKGIVHRDIKSSNIIVTETDQVKIMDFGLAKIRGEAQVTKTGTTLGTAAYMSPEQTQGTPVDSRTDIWSFGVVLFEMLTGQLPFKGDYEQAVIYSILNEEPEPVSLLRDEVPAELMQVIDKTLQKDSEKRYDHIGDLIAELHLIRQKLAAGSKSSTSGTKNTTPSIAPLPFPIKVRK